jgi:hypothetical protein
MDPDPACGQFRDPGSNPDPGFGYRTDPKLRETKSPKNKRTKYKSYKQFDKLILCANIISCEALEKFVKALSRRISHENFKGREKPEKAQKHTTDPQHCLEDMHVHCTVYERHYLADSILVGGPAVGGGSGGPRHAQVVVQTRHTLHHVQENVVAVAGEQLLHEGQVLARLEQQD